MNDIFSLASEFVEILKNTFSNFGVNTSTLKLDPPFHFGAINVKILPTDYTQAKAILMKKM